MKGYNLYYKNEKLNKFPLKREELEQILSNQIINKKIDETSVKKIFVKDIRITECTIL